MKNKYLIYCLSLAIAGASSCKKNNEDIGTGEELVLSATEQQRVEADNKFTFKMLKELAGPVENKNLMFSPLSISMAVGMTTNGANGETLEAMRKTMEYAGSTEAEVNSYYSKLIKKLPVLDPQSKVSIANSIWYRKDFTVIDAFLQGNRENYKATVESLDFSSTSAKDQINNWVNSKTNGKIPTIIERINPNVVMYLINAIYFKSNWKVQFDKGSTAKSTFYTTNNGNVQADFMKVKSTFKTAQVNEGRIYELPYGNDRYSMVIFLPAEGKSVKDVINAVDASSWNTWMGKLEKRSLEIHLPKFKFAYSEDLKKTLTDLGMGIAFSIRADFSRMTPGGGVSISEVKHKTFIEVNEEGTEAAAVTAVSIVLSAPPVPQLTKIDRPFFFAVREMKTGLILFNGVVNNPLLAE